MEWFLSQYYASELLSFSHKFKVIIEQMRLVCLYDEYQSVDNFSLHQNKYKKLSIDPLLSSRFSNSETQALIYKTNILFFKKMETSIQITSRFYVVLISFLNSIPFFLMFSLSRLHLAYYIFLKSICYCSWKNET